MATIQEIIMTRQQFTRKSSAGLFGLLMAGALTQALGQRYGEIAHSRL
jgi:hypothetical protein